MPEVVDVKRDIFNGARCKSYCWSQTHSDLEIQVKLNRRVKNEDIKVTLKANRIRIELTKVKIDTNQSSVAPKTEIILDGKLENKVNVESAYWLLDVEESKIVIYVDKVDGLWWKQLLLDEEVTQQGPKNYTVLMDHLDDGSRMVIDKLIVEQRNKQLYQNRFP